MGFYIDSYEGELLIPTEHKEKLKEILKRIYKHDFNSNSATISGFEFSEDEGHISIDSFSGKWTSWEDEFIEAIVPIVEEGSYMCFEGVDCNWRTVFRDGTYEEQHSNVYNIWDTSLSTVKHLNESTNEIEDVPAPNGIYFYFKSSDIAAIKALLDTNKIDYVDGDSILSILENNHTVFTCM